MLAMNFYANSDFGLLSGFEQGNVEIVTENGRINLLEDANNGSVMIFVAVAELLDGIRSLVAKRSEFLFIGADSSFTVQFNKADHKHLQIESSGQRLSVDLDAF